MNKLFLAILTFFAAVPVFAQNANAIFFTEGGEPFYVVMNGQRYNDQPQTNVKVTGLNPGAYKTKIIFEDQSLGTVDKTIYPEDFKEATFNIKKKKESGTTQGLKKVGNRMAKDLKKEFDNDTINTAKKEDWYVMRLLSVTDLPRPVVQPVVQQQVQQTTVQPTAPPPENVS